MNSTLRILHLEDNSNDAELVREILTEHKVNCEITRVQSRKDFEAALGNGGFDLILSDYKVPSFDGISALAIARERCPDIPYIFVSGNIGEERAIETLKNGATDYILKENLLRLVSSLKRAIREAEMKKEHRQLEEQLRQSQKMEVVGRLAGGVAHDFNNMLTVIAGYSEMLMKNLKKDDPIYIGLEEIGKAAEKSSAMTRQLLAFSRRQVLQPKVLDLNASITNAYQMFHRLIGEMIDLVIVAATDIGRVKVDPSQLEQVMLNLIVNARDAMPKGGKIIIETKSVFFDEYNALQQQGIKAGKYVLLSVKDTGMGMTEEVKAHIFEPFFTTKEAEKGTGLGLATVFGIIKQNDGSIEVDSQPGQGATFKIYLPEVKEKIDREKNKITPSEQKGSEIILLVEDETAVRTLTRKILELNGYTVLEAEGGGKAISICQEYKSTIHLLLTDFVMPCMSGEDLSEKLLVLRPEMRVIYFSGYIDQPWNQRKILEPGTAFLQKPFTPDKLARKVREVLDN